MTIGNYTFNRDDEIDRLVDLYNKAVEADLNGQTKVIKERIMAYALGCVGMRLLRVTHDYHDGDINISEITSKGKDSRYEGIIHKEKLKYWNGDLPDEFMDKVGIGDCDRFDVYHRDRVRIIVEDIPNDNTHKIAIFYWGGDTE